MPKGRGVGLEKQITATQKGGLAPRLAGDCWSPAGNGAGPLHCQVFQIFLIFFNFVFGLLRDFVAFWENGCIVGSKNNSNSGCVLNSVHQK